MNPVEKGENKVQNDQNRIEVGDEVKLSGGRRTFLVTAVRPDGRINGQRGDNQFSGFHPQDLEVVNKAAATPKFVAALA